MRPVQPWVPEFKFYAVTLEGKAAVVNVDLAAALHGPLDSHPVRQELRVTLHSPREDGLCAPEEAPAASDLEIRLVEAARTWGWIFVGRLLTGGHFTLYFYAPAESVPEGQAARTLMTLAHGYELDGGSAEDADWSAYFGFLHPDLVQRLLIENRDQLHQLQQRGDNPEVGRDLHHTARFPAESEALSAAIALTQRAFRADAPVQRGADVWVLQFHRMDRLAHGRADELSVEVLEVVRHFHGEYEGWRAEIARR